MTEINRRIARKICKRKSTCISFKKWKAMKLKTTFFNWCKDDFNINDCDEWLFWLFFSLFVFEKEIKLSATTFFITQNNLISKHHFSICLIVFRNSNIIFKAFVLIFFYEKSWRITIEQLIQLHSHRRKILYLTINNNVFNCKKDWRFYRRWKTSIEIK